MERTVAMIPKNSTEDVKVEIQEYNGYDLVGLRVFAKDPLGQEPRPTRKGITFRLHMLRPMIEALRDCEQIVQEAGLLGDGA